MNDNSSPSPEGELVLQTVAMPRDTNPGGDIFGGWLMAQMDLAGGIAAGRIAQGRVATVAIDQMSFMVPVKVGSLVSCYTRLQSVGRSSIRIAIEVWIADPVSGKRHKVTEGLFIFVAINAQGRTRPIPALDRV